MARNAQEMGRSYKRRKKHKELSNARNGSNQTNMARSVLMCGCCEFQITTNVFADFPALLVSFVCPDSQIRKWISYAVDMHRIILAPSCDYCEGRACFADFRPCVFHEKHFLSSSFFSAEIDLFL